MNLRYFVIILTSFCAIAPSPVGAAAGPDELDILLAELETRYHVQIHYRYDPSTFFPATWLSPSMELSAKAIHRQDAEALAPAIEQFFAAHPVSVIQENLEHIYLLGRLSFQTREYGGTHVGKNIYVVWDRSRKCTIPFMLERLHSEFSSILRDQYSFPDERWMRLNPPDFQYTGTGFEMLGEDDIYESNEQDLSNGFLLKYSKSSLENDFNMISAWLFTKPEELENFAGQSTPLRQKLILAEEFYQSVSGQYTFR